MAVSSTHYFHLVKGAVIASTIVSFPTYVPVKSGFQGIEREIEGRKEVDEANEWIIFFFISIPLAKIALISGIILSFARH